MKEVVIVEEVRTVIGKCRGALSNYRPDELAAIVPSPNSGSVNRRNMQC